MLRVPRFPVRLDFPIDGKAAKMLRALRWLLTGIEPCGLRVVVHSMKYARRYFTDSSSGRPATPRGVARAAHDRVVEQPGGIALMNDMLKSRITGSLDAIDAPAFDFQAVCERAAGKHRNTAVRSLSGAAGWPACFLLRFRALPQPPRTSRRSRLLIDTGCGSSTADARSRNFIRRSKLFVRTPRAQSTG